MDTRFCLVLFGLSLLGIALCSSTCAYELQKFALDGQLHIDSKKRDATLRVECQPDPDGGALTLELVVPKANTLKDFDYDDFEGPDAVAGTRALAHISVNSDIGKIEVTHAVTGSYAVDPPEAFVFELTQPSHQRGDVAALVRTVSGKHGHLQWVQSAFNAPQQNLRATFDFDATTAKRLRAVADACLSPAQKK